MKIFLEQLNICQKKKKNKQINKRILYNDQKINP